MKLDRRTLLVGAGAGAGLLVAYAAWPRGAPPSLRPRKEDALLGTAIAIGRDGRVTIAVPQVETGQGIWTGLAQIAADELGAAWETVAVAPALLSGEWANGQAEHEAWIEGLSSVRRWRLDEGMLRITAGSSSIRAFAEPMRRLAAAARVLLTEEAADRWSVAAAECTTSGGVVRHEGKALSFAQLAEGAGRRRLPSKAPLRDASGSLVGQSLPRLDALPKAKGTLRYAGDVRLPGMLFASLRLSGGGPVKVDTPAPAGVHFEQGERWLAAVATDWWAAEQALEAASVRSFGPAPGDDAAISATLDEAMAGGEVDALFETGSVDRAFGELRPLVADYSATAALHADLEPPSATARLENGLLEVWAATQAPELARHEAASAAGLSADDVLLYPMPIGGQGGRALEADLVPIVAELAKRLGKPVQVTLSRTEQVRSDAVRAPLKTRMMARTLPDGSIAALRIRVAGGDGTRAAMQRLFGGAPGGFRNAALPAVPYNIPNLRLEAVAADLPIRLGYHRAELLPAFHFFIENFFDELAHIGGRDPLSSRIALLSGNPRLAKCLIRATALGGWDGGGPGSTLGLSALTAFGSHIAVVASAVLGAGGVPQVSRLAAVVDCGKAINPLLVQQQVEGGMISSLAQASAQVPSFRHGRVLGPLGPPAPRLANTPEILVEVLPSAAPSGGVNGLGAAAAPAAVGNALAAATGRRFRALPFTAMA